MAPDDLNLLQWVIGGGFTLGTAALAYLNIKTNQMQTEHTKHVLHAQETYATINNMNAGFALAAKATEAAAKAAESFGKDLSAKVDKTQEAVHRVEVIQAGQTENLKSMDKNIQVIAESMKK